MTQDRGSFDGLFTLVTPIKSSTVGLTFMNYGYYWRLTQFLSSSGLCDNTSGRCSNLGGGISCLYSSNCTKDNVLPWDYPRAFWLTFQPLRSLSRAMKILYHRGLSEGRAYIYTTIWFFGGAVGLKVSRNMYKMFVWFLLATWIEASLTNHHHLHL